MSRRNVARFWADCMSRTLVSNPACEELRSSDSILRSKMLNQLKNSQLFLDLPEKWGQRANGWEVWRDKQANTETWTYKRRNPTPLEPVPREENLNYNWWITGGQCQQIWNIKTPDRLSHRRMNLILLWFSFPGALPSLIVNIREKLFGMLVEGGKK